MIKCEGGSEFRLPISAARPCTADRTANEPIAKKPHSRHVWESIISQTHVYTYIIIIVQYIIWLRFWPFRRYYHNIIQTVGAHRLIINFFPLPLSTTIYSYHRPNLT